MEKINSPTKTCSSCGLKKPLSAFIQVRGFQGRHYGNICATCRSKNAKDKESSSPFDEASDLKLKLRIGAKERVFIEKEQKRELSNKQEAKVEEAKKKETLTQQTDKKGIEDRNRHKIYLEAKQKQGFLSSKPVTLQTTTPRITLTEQERAIEAQKQLTINEEETKKTASLDLTVPFLDSQFGEIKYQSQAFLNFIYGAGASGPIRQTMERLFGKKESPPQTPAAQEKNYSNKNEKDPLTEYIDNTWKPTSRRR